MSILDIILIVIFLAAGFSGFKKGFVHQAAGLVGLLLGIWGAIHFSDFTASLLRDTFSLTSEYLPLIAFAVTFTVIVVLVHFVGALVEGIVKMAFLGIVNKLLGVVFGVLKTALILSVILLLVGKVSNRIRIIPDNFGENSMFYGPVQRLAPRIFPYLNFDEIKSTFEEKFIPKKEEASNNGE